MDQAIFFNDWASLGRILVIAPCAYVSLVLFLRISGKRTLAKLNAFDLVVTVSLGSTLATQILSKDTPLIDGVLAFAMLIGMQWSVSSLSMRSRRFRNFVRAEPRVLLRDGEFQREAMRAERITEGEVLQAIRSSGGAQFEQARCVHLETDGSLSVMLNPSAQ